MEQCCFDQTSSVTFLSGLWPLNRESFRRAIFLNVWKPWEITMVYNNFCLESQQHGIKCGKPVCQNLFIWKCIEHLLHRKDCIIFFSSFWHPPSPHILLLHFLKSHSWIIDLVVATDDDKIAECCRGFGADVIMTSESCRNGRHLGFLLSCKIHIINWFLIVYIFCQTYRYWALQWSSSKAWKEVWYCCQYSGGRASYWTRDNRWRC